MRLRKAMIQDMAEAQIIFQPKTQIICLQINAVPAAAAAIAFYSPAF